MITQAELAELRRAAEEADDPTARTIAELDLRQAIAGGVQCSRCSRAVEVEGSTRCNHCRVVCDPAAGFHTVDGSGKCVKCGTQTRRPCGDCAHETQVRFCERFARGECHVDKWEGYEARREGAPMRYSPARQG